MIRTPGAIVRKVTKPIVATITAGSSSVGLPPVSLTSLIAMK